MIHWLWIRGPSKVACHLYLSVRWSEKFERTGAGNQANTYFLGCELGGLDNSPLLSRVWGHALTFFACPPLGANAECALRRISTFCFHSNLEMHLFGCCFILIASSLKPLCGETHRFVFNLEFLLVLFFDNKNCLK